MRSLIERHDLTLDPSELELAPGQEPFGAVEELLELAVLTRDAGKCQPRPLPHVMVVDLRHGRAEALLQLRLRRYDVLPLPLQRRGVREMQLERQDSDVPGAHRIIQAARARLALRNAQPLAAD